MPMDLLCRLQSENRRLKEENRQLKSQGQQVVRPKWTTEMPTLDGWYWWRRKGDKKKKVVELRHGEVRTTDDGSMVAFVFHQTYGGVWLGPILPVVSPATPCTFPDCMSARAVRAAGEEYQRGVVEGLRLAVEAAEDIPTTVSVHATAHDASVATRCKEAIVMAIGAVNATAIEEKRILAKYQPCGCVICTCEENEENRCMGCGAKNCGTHPVGQFPSPLYEAR